MSPVTSSTLQDRPAPGQVHDPRPRIKLHRRVRRRPRRRRDPDRALQHPDAPHERDRRTLDRRMPPRTPGPHPHLEPGPSATDPAPVRDPPQSAPTAPLLARRRAAETATRAGRPRPLPHPKTSSGRLPDQRIPPGGMTWTRLSARTGSRLTATFGNQAPVRNLRCAALGLVDDERLAVAGGVSVEPAGAAVA